MSRLMSLLVGQKKEVLIVFASILLGVFLFFNHFAIFDTYVADSHYVVSGDKVYYNAFTSQNGVELYVFDKNKESFKSYDLIEGRTSSSPSDFVLSGNNIFFLAADRLGGRSIWKTVDGAAPLLIFPHLEGKMFASGLVSLGEYIFFSGYDSKKGYELFYFNVQDTSSDPTVFDVNVGDSSFPHYLTPIGHELFFIAYIDGIENLVVFDPGKKQAKKVFGFDDYCVVYRGHIGSSRRDVCLFPQRIRNTDELSEVVVLKPKSGTMKLKVYYAGYKNNQISFPKTLSFPRVVLDNTVHYKRFYLAYIQLPEGFFADGGGEKSLRLKIEERTFRDLNKYKYPRFDKSEAIEFGAERYCRIGNGVLSPALSKVDSGR